MWYVATHALNTHELIVSVALLSLICSKKQIPKWRRRCKFFSITGQPFRQIVPTFAARSSGVLAYLEEPGNESVN